jgi:undecaprenyl diphosphate synthase
VEATKSIVQQVLDGRLAINNITEAIISENLTTSVFPDPELMIRTSGECRISNFLLYQLAYAELYFTDTLWPAFGKEDLIKALTHYQSRERRFGKTSEQIQIN